MFLLQLCLAGIAVVNTADHFISKQSKSECVNQLDWDAMMASGQKPMNSVSLSFNEDDNTLDIDVSLEYVGTAQSRSTHTATGTSYVIDFVPFTMSDSVDATTDCSNRNASAYLNHDFEKWWQYSTTPWEEGHIGTEDFLAYGPPTMYWSLEYVNENGLECGHVHYHGRFSLNSFQKCVDKQGSNVLQIEEDNNFFYISGKLHVSIVSPLNSQINTGFNKIYSIIHQPFTFKISKAVDVVIPH